MKWKMPPVRICVVILVFSMLWRIVGAPVSWEEWQTPFWQARALLPNRLQRVLCLWISSVQTKEEKEDSLHVSVYLTQQKELRQMPLEEYVCGVVAAEMPAAYHLEALKAQAVAARTRVLQQMQHGGCQLHAGADICTDSTHCQAYASNDACQEMWQQNYEAYRTRIMQAQRETQDELLTFEGRPITVVYHAISGGKTEDAQTVFAQSVPYLVSVESAGEEKVNGYQVETFIPFEEIAKKMSALLHSEQIAVEDVQRTLAVGSYTPTGRVQTILLGQHQIPAADFRRALGLRSTWFSISMDPKGVTFHQKGYGHGVGMSQAGANVMAAEGKKYSEILYHYYPGVTLEKRME